MLRELRSRHREVARLTVQGFKPQEIAMQLDMAAQTIYKIIRDPLCQGFMAGLEDKVNESVVNVRKKLIELNGPAINNISDILDLEKEAPAPAQTRLAAAKDVLDRNGYKAPEKVNVAHAHFTMQDLQDIRNRAQAVNTDYLVCGD